MTTVKIIGNVLFDGLIGNVLEKDEKSVLVKVLVSDGSDFNVRCKLSEVVEVENSLV